MMVRTQIAISSYLAGIMTVVLIIGLLQRNWVMALGSLGLTLLFGYAVLVKIIYIKRIGKSDEQIQIN
jgi:hypothetical protein